MHTFMDAKLMAKLLRQALAEQGTQVSHSASLELVARQFGLANWNILSAKVEQANGAGDSELPKGWHTTGVSSRLYRTGVDKTLGAAWVESRPEYAELVRNDEVCTIMQSVDAAQFRGQRLRLSSRLRTERVLGAATIWFRIDGPSGSLRFENLQRYQHAALPGHQPPRLRPAESIRPGHAHRLGARRGWGFTRTGS